MAASHEEIAELIRQSHRIVAFTGAGISTAAGIPDFRGPRGLYVTRRYDPETVFDIDYFRRDPKPFYDFTRDFTSAIADLKPTFTHEFLARLEREGRLAAVITQNIDHLHQLAGSSNVIAVHGNYSRNRCLSCGASLDYAELLRKLETEDAPRCACGGLIKPEVVFFGEAVKGMDEAGRLARDCDLMLVLGSSLVVYPAAALPSLATGEVVVVNRGEVALAPAPNRRFFDCDLDEFFREVARLL